jgi:hypothetical protein
MQKNSYNNKTDENCSALKKMLRVIHISSLSELYDMTRVEWKNCFMQILCFVCMYDNICEHILSMTWNGNPFAAASSYQILHYEKFERRNYPRRDYSLMTFMLKSTKIMCNGGGCAFNLVKKCFSLESYSFASSLMNWK